MPTWEQINQQVKRKPHFDLFYWADIFMSEYKMSLEDFKKLNVQAFYLLKDRMEKRYEEQNKRLNKKGRKR